MYQHLMFCKFLFWGNIVFRIQHMFIFLVFPVYSFEKKLFLALSTYMVVCEITFICILRMLLLLVICEFLSQEWSFLAFSTFHKVFYISINEFKLFLALTAFTATQIYLSKNVPALNVFKKNFVSKIISRIQHMSLFIVFHVYSGEKKIVLTLTTHMVFCVIISIYIQLMLQHLMFVYIFFC